MTEEIKNEELNENKNEVVAEKKEENKSDETPITQTFNFKYSLVLLIIIASLDLLHIILSCIGLSGNLTWFILNTGFVAASGVLIYLDAMFLKNKAIPNKDKDITSFILSLVGVIIASINAVWWLIDDIRNLIGIFR